jgi:hypothetical protein
MARNRYAAACTVCGETVFAYQGRLTKATDGWVVEHDRCPVVEAAEREAAQAAAQARFEEALTELAALDLTEIELVELRILVQAQHNAYTVGKVRIVQEATTLDEALRRIGESCQGMTMDYMTEFARERDAAGLAREYAQAVFA